MKTFFIAFVFENVFPKIVKEKVAANKLNRMSPLNIDFFIIIQFIEHFMFYQILMKTIAVNSSIY